jgi:hypothetical protein
MHTHTHTHTHTLHRPRAIVLANRRRNELFCVLVIASVVPEAHVKGAVLAPCVSVVWQSVAIWARDEAQCRGT